MARVSSARFHSRVEWINTQWYIHMTKYYSVMVRNGASSHENIWRNLKSTLLIKSQSNKATHCIIPSIGHSGKDRTMGQ